MFEVSDDQTYKPAGVNATLDIIRAWTSAVPKGKLLLLDLWADSTPLWNISRSFFGADYIWCMCVYSTGVPRNLVSFEHEVKFHWPVHVRRHSSQTGLCLAVLLLQDA